MYAENEILFPPGAIPRLRFARGEAWRRLVDQVSVLPNDHPESLAFSLAMIGLNGCLSCETDSFRAMKGCSECSLQTLRRYRGEDSTLLVLYQRSLEKVNAYLTETSPLEKTDRRPQPARAA